MPPYNFSLLHQTHVTTSQMSIVEHNVYDVALLATLQNDPENSELKLKALWSALKNNADPLVDQLAAAKAHEVELMEILDEEPMESREENEEKLNEATDARQYVAGLLQAIFKDQPVSLKRGQGPGGMPPSAKKAKTTKSDEDKEKNKQKRLEAKKRTSTIPSSPPIYGQKGVLMNQNLHHRPLNQPTTYPMLAVKKGGGYP